MPATSQLRTLDGQPLDPASLTLGQVVESAYAHANGDIDDVNTFVAADDVQRSDDVFGDRLQEFLVSSLAEEPAEENTTEAEAWAEARARAAGILREVQGVYDALHRFGPQS